MMTTPVLVGIAIFSLLLLGFMFLLLIFIINPKLIFRLRYGIKYILFGGYRKGFSNGWKHLNASKEIGHNIWRIFNDYKRLYAPYEHFNQFGIVGIFKILNTFLSYIFMRVFLLFVWILIPITFLTLIIISPFSLVISLTYGLVALLLLTIAYFLIQSSFSDDIFEELKVGSPLIPYRFISNKLKLLIEDVGSVMSRKVQKVFDHIRRLIK